MQIFVMVCRARVIQTKVAEVRVYGTLLQEISQVVLSLIFYVRAFVVTIKTKEKELNKAIIYGCFWFINMNFSDQFSRFIIFITCASP